MGLLGLFWRLSFSCLYLEWSSKVLLEVSWVDFNGSGTDLGKLLARFWEEISRVLAGSGLLWAILGYWDVLG